MKRAQNIIIIADIENARKLQSDLSAMHLSSTKASSSLDNIGDVSTGDIDIVLVDFDSSWTRNKYEYLWTQLHDFKQANNIKIITLIDEDDLVNVQTGIFPDDFIVKPYNALELGTRIKRLLTNGNYPPGCDVIAAGNIEINTASCEVTVGGMPLVLTHKEYELLRFLAGNKDRVFTREILLEQVWGYDYYGGDRTVDVHIRRLRSKLNDTDGSYIKTVRNIGYKFSDT